MMCYILTTQVHQMNYVKYEDGEKVYIRNISIKNKQNISLIQMKCNVILNMIFDKMKQIMLML